MRKESYGAKLKKFAHATVWNQYFVNLTNLKNWLGQQMKQSEELKFWKYK